MKVKIVKNSDNDYLGLIGCVGYVDEVNGAGAQEIPEFVPTRHELLELAKYWQKVCLENRYFWYLEWQVGSTDLRQEAFAQRRLNRIAEALGDDVVKSATDEVWEEFGKTCDPRVWNHFRNNLPPA